MKAQVVNGKIAVTADTDGDAELLNFMGFGILKASIERVVDERTPNGGMVLHDVLTIEFYGNPPTPA